MITRGIVETIVDRYTVKVRMPLLNRIKGTSVRVLSEDLNEAVMCTLPNYHPNINVGDVVFVAFEDNNFGKPVVIGYLYRENMGSTLGDIKLNSLEVQVSAHLTEDTTIGNVSSEDISNLQGSTGNLQQQINELENESEQIQSFIDYWTADNIDPTALLASVKVNGVPVEIDDHVVDINFQKESDNDVFIQTDSIGNAERIYFKFLRYSGEISTLPSDLNENVDYGKVYYVISTIRQGSTVLYNVGDYIIYVGKEDNTDKFIKLTNNIESDYGLNINSTTNNATIQFLKNGTVSSGIDITGDKNTTVVGDVGHNTIIISTDVPGALSFEGSYNASTNKITTRSAVDAQIDAKINLLDSTTNNDETDIYVLTNIVQADGKIVEVDNVDANKSHSIKLQKISQTGNVNDLIQTTQDTLILNGSIFVHNIPTIVTLPPLSLQYNGNVLTINSSEIENQYFDDIESLFTESLIYWYTVNGNRDSISSIIDNTGTDNLIQYSGFTLGSEEGPALSVNSYYAVMRLSSIDQYPNGLIGITPVYEIE